MTGTAEEHAIEEHKVLDKGFVKLVDFMGGDQRAVESARVTFGSASKGEEKDKQLVDYLLAHGHHTPFEHSVFQFHVKLPIFVARQWMRHRIACVTGDTKLYFDLPSGPRNGHFNSYRMTVEDFHRKWHEGARPIPHSHKTSMLVAIPQRQRLKRMMLRNLDENRRVISHTRVIDIFRTGEKPVFEVTLEDGKTIRCTQDHRFLFKDGWKTLKDATGLSLNGDMAAYRSSLPSLTVNGRVVENPLYRDKEWLSGQYARPEATDHTIAKILGVSGEVIRKWRRIHGLTGIKPRGFLKNFVPWNKGRSYRLWDGPRPLSSKHLEAIRAARSGPKSNFWKGGVSSRRAGIARWTTEAAPRLFARSGYRCLSCGRIGGKLHAHHIIPVWADERKAFEPANLAALCETCHREIHRTNSELDFASRVTGKAAVTPYRLVKKNLPDRHLVPVRVRIASIRYLGVQITYDLTVEGPFHNYVANGIVTHNSYNEVSARYTEVQEEFYVPAEFRVQDKINRQGSEKTGALDNARLLAIYKKSLDTSYADYRALIEAGVAREMARMVLPVAQYTQFHWTVNARSLMNFLSLRMDSHAQLEIQEYANAIAGMFKARMPWTWEAFSKKHGTKSQSSKGTKFQN